MESGATAAANDKVETVAPVAAEQSPVVLDAAPEESANAQATEPAQAPESAQQSAAAEGPEVSADAHHSSNAVHAAPGLFVVLPSEIPISRRLMPEQ